MKTYPEYVKVNGKKYKINTDFRVALECEEIAQSDVDNYEKGLAIIYKLYGDEGLNDFENHDQLARLAEKYLRCGKDIKPTKEEPDMDFIEDYNLIKISFRSDFNINLEKENMHYWEFIDWMNGLSNSELGNCCVLNKVRNLRNTDLSKIKDIKERNRIKEAQEAVSLKKKKKGKTFTEKQIKSMENFYKKIGKE